MAPTKKRPAKASATAKITAKRVRRKNSKKKKALANKKQAPPMIDKDHRKGPKKATKKSVAKRLRVSAPKTSRSPASIQNATNEEIIPASIQIQPSSRSARTSSSNAE